MYIHGNNTLKKGDFVNNRVYNEEHTEEEKHERRYFWKQKLYGLVFIVLGIVCPYLMEMDATMSVLFIPLGLVLLFTKEKAFEY